MVVVIDTSVLLLILHPGIQPAMDPETNEVTHKAAERVDYLIRKLGDENAKILIPTPVLSEILVGAGNAKNEYIEKFNKDSVYRIADFDQKAAIEAAVMVKKTRDLKTVAKQPQNRQKIKFDRQIIAISKVEGAHTIYSDDKDIYKYAREVDIRCIRTYELDLPPEDPQLDLI